MSVKATSSRHIPALDGLRGIAILLVLVWHIAPPLQSFFPGWSGVDLFFVISGYLICAVIYKDLRTGSFSIAKFYERRFKRILPALCVVLLFCLTMATLVLSPVEAYALAESSIATAHSVSCLFTMQS